MSDNRHDRVSRRAYELWEQEGGEHGRHEDHWHRANAEVEETVAVAAPDGTMLTVPADTVDGTAEEKPARKKVASKAAAKPAVAPPTDKAPARPRKPKAK